jgi:hypothetical protein
VFFKRKRMLKKEAAGWEGPAAKKRKWTPKNAENAEKRCADYPPCPN